MLLGCLKFRKIAESKNSRVEKTNKGNQFFYWSVQYDSEKSRFIKEQEAGWLLSKSTFK